MAAENNTSYEYPKDLHPYILFEYIHYVWSGLGYKFNKCFIIHEPCPQNLKTC